MSNDIADLTAFEPGVFILLNDVMTGVRKLARVTDDGQAYIDLDSEDCTPLPIYTTLQPAEAGNILGWGLYLVDHHPELHPAWRTLCDRLVNSGEGVLTYNRAAHWAFVNRTFDFDKAIAAGKAESEAVAAGRKVLDDMARNAGGQA
ncbi:hypothetical protein EIP75_21725 [Aquabacterium soli]|uniref:Uncharacterized protein n=1 Tax=Aquabacterium soli TaxID=2493092 RepID=A0A426V2W3_9BURK|nr:hypothetical protein [Aquabacterium soli]RRS01197.1 hypothetical protein EIP75_21725 [Aquabacterium soli]